MNADDDISSITVDEETHFPQPLRYPEGGVFDVIGSIPAYVQLMTLEELGFLYLLECCQDISREAVYRLGCQRGLDAERIAEVADFFFMRNRRRTGLAVGDPVSVDEGDHERPVARKTSRRAASTKTSLGGHETEVGRLPVKGSDVPLLVKLDFLQMLERAYPQVNVQLEIERASVWLRTHPDRMKTARGMGRFLNTWMQNASREAAVRSAVTHVERKSSSPFGVTDSSREVTPASDNDGGSGATDNFDAALDVLFSEES